MRYFTDMTEAERRLLLRVGYMERARRRAKADGNVHRENEWAARLRRLWRAIDALS